MVRRIVSCALTISLMVSSVQIFPLGISRAKAYENTDNFILEEGSYNEGHVIVTVADSGDNILTKEGELPVDDKITVEHSWDFGDARPLAGNTLQRLHYRDKNMYVAEVSSEYYSTYELMSELKNMENVVSVEPDYCQYKQSVNDTYADWQWYLDGTNVKSEGIHYSGLEQKAMEESSVPVVAVVDTGVDYTHEDLAGRMWVNTYDSLEGTYGYDFGDEDSDPMDCDIDSHGTHCAGIIGAAANNNTGIAGVSSNVRIMALKVFDSNGEAANSSIINAFNYIYEAQQAGVNIAAVNCSWGGGESPSMMEAVINKIGEAGALFIFAAGNDGINYDDAGNTAVGDEEDIYGCPYDINSPYTVIVGASGMSGERAQYSNYGISAVDIMAPGSQMLSTVEYDNFLPDIMPASDRDSICSYYTSFDSGSVTDTASYYVEADFGSVEFEYAGTQDLMDDAGSGSMCMRISYTSGDDMDKTDTEEYECSIYVDVTSLDISPPTESYYVSYWLGVYEDAGYIDWVHYSRRREMDASEGTSDNYITINGRTYINIIRFSGSQKLPDIYIDNIVISTDNLDERYLLKYDVETGTSMAAPVVTGAAAILAAFYSGDNALQRRERLMSCVDKKDSLLTCCKAGGILDISKIPYAACSSDNSGAGGSGTGDAGTGSSGSADSGNNPGQSGNNYTPVNASDSVQPAVNTGSPQPTVTPVTKEKVYVKKIKLNKKKTVLYYGKKLKLKVTVLPEKASNKKVRWYVSGKDKKYLTVNQKGIVKAKIKGIGHNVKVYAKAKDGSGVSAFCLVKIIEG